MNSRNPKFWALVGFGVGAVIATAGGVTTPLDSIIGGLIQAAIWFGVSSLILGKKSQKIIIKDLDSHTPNLQTTSRFNDESSEEALARLFDSTNFSTQADSEEFKNCPMCAEQIRFAAKKCRFCQHILS